MVNDNAWTKWLNEHTSRPTYDRYPGRVSELLSGPGDPVAKFEKLARNKNLVLLTKAPLGKKIASTFLHSVVVCPITPDELHYVAKSGMAKGAGVELDPTTVFVRTATPKFVPLTAELMKATSVGDLEGVKVPRSGPKKKVSNFALLTPELAETAQRTEMKPAEMLVAFVETIRARAGTPGTLVVYEGENAEAGGVGDEDLDEEGDVESEAAEGMTETPDEDRLLGEMGKPYEEVLRFLWTLHKRPAVIKAPTVGVLTEAELVAWDKEVDKMVTPQGQEDQVTPTVVRGPEAPSQDGAATAMTKLSEALTRYQEAAAKVQEEKCDVKQKAWNRLPQIQRNIILMGGDRRG